MGDMTDPKVRAAAAALGRMGGQAAKGAKKRRGGTAHYRRIGALARRRRRCEFCYAIVGRMTDAEWETAKHACEKHRKKGA